MNSSRKLRSELSRTELERKIPAGPVTLQTRQRLDIENEVLELDGAGFPMLVRQRVKNKFLRLAEQGSLSFAEANAAMRLRAYEDRCFTNMSPTYALKVDGHARPGSALIAQIEARRNLEGALAHLNSNLRRVALAFILEREVPGMGHSLVSIGRYYHPNARDNDNGIAGKTLVKAACSELAVFFGLQNASA